MKKIIPIAVFALVLAIGTYAGSAKAATVDLFGWAWSSNIGWMSFNSNDNNTGTNGVGKSSVAYSVKISTTTSDGLDGVFSGHAWSDHIGWLSFNRLETGNPPSEDIVSSPATTDPIAKINMATGAVTGWARACAGTVNGDCSAVTGGGLTFTATILNLQDGFFVQKILVRNNTGSTFAGVRLVVDSLTPSTYSCGSVTYTNSLSSPSGTNTSGKSYLQYNKSLSVGETISITAKYYSACRVPVTPIYSIYAVTGIRSEPILPAESVQLTGVTNTHYSSYNVLGFTMLNVGRSFAVQYSDDLGITWHTRYAVDDSIASYAFGGPAGSSMQWLDYGAKETLSPPTDTRQYRVYELPAGSYPGPGGEQGPYIPSGSAVNPKSGGWDGWIHLSGTNHDTVTGLTNNDVSTKGVSYNTHSGLISGYAWGSDVVGWLNFYNVSSTPVASSCTISSAVATGKSVSVTFSSPKAGIGLGYQLYRSGVSNYVDYMSGYSSPNQPVTLTDSNVPNGTYTYTVKEDTLSNPLTCQSGSVIVNYTPPVTPPGTGTLKLSIGPNLAKATGTTLTVTQGDPFVLKLTDPTNVLNGYTCSITSDLGPTLWNKLGMSPSYNTGILKASDTSSTISGDYVFTATCSKAGDPTSVNSNPVTLQVVSGSLKQL